MAGLCKGGNEPPGSLKATPFHKMSLFLFMKRMWHPEIAKLPHIEMIIRTAGAELWGVFSICQYIISRSMTFVSRKKSILSRLRTSHNLRDIAKGQFRSPQWKEQVDRMDEEYAPQVISKYRLAGRRNVDRPEDEIIRSVSFNMDQITKPCEDDDLFKGKLSVS
ncbi:hypothetical protein ANN_08819 [Periplaneta americana]|uniref:Uncharacterized protein n=1 Tax=Periplaneta americana TaxID=6978 RepID=A0ABQ8T3V9_PERAM|nr:hypothetical protein ANN_08819 [Periplaneta americana]